MIELTARLVSAYLARNKVPIGSVPDLIASVGGALTRIGQTAKLLAEPEQAQRKPRVNPKKSVFPGYIICLDDGKKFRSLKGHLSALGTTPDEYRKKWGLPSNYPMVAPDYSAIRSALAKDMGLGTIGRPDLKKTAQAKTVRPKKA